MSGIRMHPDFSHVPIKSPSRTKAWLFCPWLVKLRDDGWRSRHLLKRDLSAVLGNILHVGLACWHETDSIAWARTAANYRYAYEVQVSSELGLSDLVRAIEEHYAPMMLALVYAMTHSVLPAAWTTLEAEMRLQAYGPCILDLVLQTPIGVTFLDYKTRIKQDAQYDAEWAAQYEIDSQVYHYAWSLEQYLERPITHYAVVLLVILPRPRMKLFTFPVHRTTMEMWLGMASGAWRDIHEANGIPPRENETHMDGRWKCEMYDACVLYHRDPNLMRVSYVQEVSHG